MEIQTRRPFRSKLEKRQIVEARGVGITCGASARRQCQSSVLLAQAVSRRRLEAEDTQAALAPVKISAVGERGSRDVGPRRCPHRAVIRA